MNLLTIFLFFSEGTEEARGGAGGGARQLRTAVQGRGVCAEGYPRKTKMQIHIWEASISSPW